MNIYKQKRKWKFFLFVAALLIGTSSLWYTNKLMDKLSIEERKRIELWAEATQKLINAHPEDDISFLFEVQKNNETIPVLLVDKEDNIISFRNIDSVKMEDIAFREKILNKYKNNDKDYFVIETDEGEELNRIYYHDSFLLVQLQYYPYIQLGIISLFILVSYFAFSIARKAEQDHVWLGMSKETAHQLGTPISSLLAWIEVMKMNLPDEKIIEEVSKDVHRLEKITERFSKIGSKPVLQESELKDIIEKTISYIRARTSDAVLIETIFPKDQSLKANINTELFEWVVENLCKNSIDAIAGEGKIKLDVLAGKKQFIIDITDSGKGIPKSKFNAVFQPGYTTKNRGWGLGLSLSKRIIEQYHNGKIFVKSSEPNIGTTIRIVLQRL
jgi:signal transduction histidine kinase